MRLCFTADIHHPRSGVLPGILPEMVESANPDAFVMAGDMSDGSMAHFRECLSYFGRLSVPKCLVMGNHDLWLRDGWGGPRDSMNKIHELLRISKEMGFHPLWDSPLVLEGLALAGNVGWYDYRFRSLPLPTSTYERKRYLGYVWNDANFIRWRYSDAEFNDLCLSRLGSHLGYLDGREDVREIVVVSHHLPFAECVLRRGVETFDFFNAYMGSPLIGELISAHPKVGWVAFGHSHGRDIPDRRQYSVGSLEAYNVTVDFDNPVPFVVDTECGSDLCPVSLQRPSNEISEPTPFKRGFGS